MLIFAHGGEEHITSTESSVHYMPLIIGITAVIIITVLILAYVFSRQSGERPNTLEEDE